MKKILIKAVFCAALLLSAAALSACGFNRIMIEYLSDRDNYSDMQVIVQGLETYSQGYGGELNQPSDLSLSNPPEQLYLKVIYNNHESTFELHDENIRILAVRGFFKDLSYGDTVTVCATRWTYMDGDFNYVASVSMYGREYLSFEDGLANIVAMMNADKSLL